MKKLYLVDVSGMFFRAFYAIRPLSNQAGMPTNALYGFLAMTVKLLREIRPDYMAFCFDRPEHSFRKELDPNYKAHRKEMPAELVPQVPYIRKMAEALGIACYDHPGFEADDVIGTLAKIGRDHDLEVVIVSSDKDFGQLVRPHVTMFDSMKDVRYDEPGVVEKWGIEPRKVIDYLAIVGDSSDNVPGITGIGEKGAQKLLSEFESLEDIYANLDKVRGESLKKKLEAGKADAFLSKKLVTIVCDMPLEIKLEDIKLKPIVREELRALLTELDFKNFAKTLLGSEESTAAVVPGVPPVVPSFAGAEANSPSSSSNPFTRPAVGTVSVSAEAGASSPTVHAVGPLIAPIREVRYGIAELESWLKPEAETWAFATDRACYLAQQSAAGQGAAEWIIAEIAADGPELGRMLSEKHLLWRGFDLKRFCRMQHVRQPRIAWDQMLAAYVIRAGHIDSPHPLFTLYNGEPLPELPSASQLLTAHLRLEAQLRRKLESVRGERVLFDIEQPLVPILLEMEENGVKIDTAALKQQSQGLSLEIQALEKEIHQELGGVFNIGSPKQLGHVLFEKMKMPTGKRTKTGYSTDNDVLEKLTKDFPVTAKILQWRELSKLRSTYVDALPQLVSPLDGRVHTTFNQALTSTGRLSSTNPNLQNIPIRTERGHLLRRAFVADEECEIVSADYSQIELRILAHITSDPGLVNAFERDLDIHAATASEIFEVPLESVTSEMRRQAKAVNFGLAYGQGAFGLAETLQISRSQATEIINRYFQRFAGVKSYMSDIVEEAKRTGYVETVFGRRRYIDELFASSAAVRKFGERAAINAPIQGTASDLVKLAMLKVGVPHGARPILQVHDEIVLEARSEKVADLCGEVKSKMESVADLKVPLRVNTGHGKNWDEAHA